MKFQLLVNHYKEDKSIVDKFLSSLAKQKDVKFDVLILSDGGIKLDLKESKYPFNIMYAYKEHTGVCNTRNILLDKSNADYVMFCDIDDEFTEPTGLKTLFDKTKYAPDIVASPFSVERNPEEGNEVGIIENDTLHVHGKIFRKQYLVDNNIRFPDEMEISGDMMFLWLAFSLTNKILWIDKSFILWKWNKNSVTRQKSDHHVRTYDKTLKCYTLLAEDLKKRNRIDLYLQLIATIVAMIYVDISWKEWQLASEDLRSIANQSIKDTLNLYFRDYKLISENLRRTSYDVMINFTHRAKSAGSFEDMIPFINGFIAS